MKISVIAPKLTLGDIEGNHKIVEQHILEAGEAGADAILLPELWNTSYYPKNAKELADVEGERTIPFLSKLAKKVDANIIGGSVANLIDGELFNTTFVVDRSGEHIASYNKVHLFSPLGEDEVFNSGNEMTVFEIDGIKCGVANCYDLRFTEWIRMYALAGVEIFFLPAAWPNLRDMHWDTLNRARAIENQMFLACTNLVGVSGDSIFGGRAAIIDPWGEYVVTPDATPGVKTGEIDLSIIKDIRDRINVFRDRKPELYDVSKDIVED